MIQAKTGWARARRHFQLLGVLVALLVFAAVGVPQGASAAKKPKEPKDVYLALGDSLAFGYSQKLLNEHEKEGDPATAFEHGYVQDYYNAVDTGGKIALINLGCPGETSASLIGPGLVAKIEADGIKGVTGEAPCAYHESDRLPLHDEYGGPGKSQLEAALAAIAKATSEAKTVKAITLNIGPNDILHYLAKLESEAKAKGAAKVESEAKALVAAKVKAITEQEVEAYVIEQVIPQAYGESGGAEPAFREDIARDAAAYSGAHRAALEKLALEDGVAYNAEHKAELAEEAVRLGEELAAKDAAELEAEGVAFVTTEIEAHVAELFGQILTNVRGIVTELKKSAPKAKVIYVGLYDPYGSLLEEGVELKPGFRTLAGLFNTEAKTLITAKKGIKGCFTDPATVFNPGGATEPEALQKFTNMANTEEYEGKHDGPDIHPTPLGYEEIAKQIETECKF